MKQNNDPLFHETSCTCMNPLMDRRVVEALSFSLSISLCLLSVSLYLSLSLSFFLSLALSL